MEQLKENKFYPKWHTNILDGKVVIRDWEQFDNHLIPFEGKEMHLILKDIYKERSRPEEKFYHAVVVRMVAGAMDISDREAHELLKGLWLRVEEKGKYGRYERVMSTTELTDKAYREYWEECIRWAALPTLPEGLSQKSGLELFIPTPNMVDYESGRDY